jgi:hypothetical protein
MVKLSPEIIAGIESIQSAALTQRMPFCSEWPDCRVQCMPNQDLERAASHVVRSNLSRPFEKFHNAFERTFLDAASIGKTSGRDPGDEFGPKLMSSRCVWFVFDPTLGAKSVQKICSEEAGLGGIR